MRLVGVLSVDKWFSERLCRVVRVHNCHLLHGLSLILIWSAIILLQRDWKVEAFWDDLPSRSYWSSKNVSTLFLILKCWILLHGYRDKMRKIPEAKLHTGLCNLPYPLIIYLLPMTLLSLLFILTLMVFAAIGCPALLPSHNSICIL